MLSHSCLQLSCVWDRGEPATFGSLGMVLIIWLEAAIRSKVIGQEVQRVRIGTVLSGLSEMSA